MNVLCHTCIECPNVFFHCCRLVMITSSLLQVYLRIHCKLPLVSSVCQIRQGQSVPPLCVLNIIHINIYTDTRVHHTRLLQISAVARPIHHPHKLQLPPTSFHLLSSVSRLLPYQLLISVSLKAARFGAAAAADC